MKNDYVFNTYNELNKEFEVHVMLVGNQYQFKLTKRLDGTKPSKVTLADVMSRLDQIDKRIDMLEQKVDARFNALEKRIDTLEKRLDNIVLKNNLIE